MPFAKLSALRRKIEAPPPPDDPIEGAAWLSKVLRRELHAVLVDPSISDTDRRAEVLKYSRAITSATPHNELAAIKEQMRNEESQKEGLSLGGELVNASSSNTGYLRAKAKQVRKK
jgi:hypothetical protein